MHVVATAGHVDHGKSTLVLALTGTDPDRLAEEKARGLTIDLGFAEHTLRSGREIAFVDVPGHVRFLKNMLAGVGMVDACVFVVAANEGWKPQSEEHLRVLDLLGLRHGIVALTKAALVDHSALERARATVVERTAGTFLEGAEIVAIDAPTGYGLERFDAALERALADTPAARDAGRPRLWVDRSFTVRGAGHVVTGTLTGGTIPLGATLDLYPPRISGTPTVRVRNIQTHHRTVELAEPGHRIALNLTGVGHAPPIRGDALVHRAQWMPTDVVDATLTVLGVLDHPVTRSGAYLAYVGSGEYPVRLRVLGASEVPAGGEGLVRLYLPAQLPLVRGDRYVLRESGRAETVGGGVLLDVAPVLPPSRARPDGSAERIVAERGWVEAADLEAMTGERHAANVGGRWIVDPLVRETARGALERALEESGPLGLDLATLDERSRALLGELEGVVVEGGRARPAGRRALPDELAGHPFVVALRDRPYAPPAPEEFGVSGSELRAAVVAGLAIKRGPLYFAPEAVEGASRVVARLLEVNPEGVALSAIRQELGTSRKYAMPLLEHLDAIGVTRRRGELRIAGPRLRG